MSDISNELYDCRVDMPGETYCLYDLATWKNGLAFKKIDFSETGVPVIKIAELNNGIGASTAYTNGTYSEEVHLLKGDMVFSWSGNPQTSIDVFWFPLKEGWLNQHIFKVTAYENIVLKEYFYYLMKSLKPVFTKIASNKQTTGLGHVTITDLKKIKVTIPSLYTQITIINTIKPVDDKIDINKAINRNLSEQAQTIFKEWFIEYGKHNGVKPTTWKELTLEDVAQLSAGGDKPKEVSSVPTAKCSVPIYSNGISDEGLYGYTNKAKIEVESVTVSARGTIGYVCLRQEPYVPIVRLVSVVPKGDIMTAKYLYLWLESLHIMGTGTTQQQLTVPDFKKTKITVPDYEVIKEFTELVKPLYSVIQRNKKQNVKLLQLRDSLLSKLMSGELDVSDLDI